MTPPLVLWSYDRTLTRHTAWCTAPGCGWHAADSSIRVAYAAGQQHRRQHDDTA